MIGIPAPGLPPPWRRCVVMCADLAGYSALCKPSLWLVQDVMTAYHKALWDSTDRFTGRVVKFTEGDDAILAFNNSRFARAAFDVAKQTLSSDYERLKWSYREAETLLQELRFDGCISAGIAAGDVVLLPCEIWGDPVNAASRLGEDKAKGGELLEDASCALLP